jgi:ribose transport system substrate-binding protein
VMLPRSTFAALAAAFLISSAGCGQAKKTIGVSVLTLKHEFFIEIGRALTKEANKHGYEVALVSGEFDLATQDKQVKDFLVRGVDAIVLSPCESKGIGQVIEEANRAGVPVFTVDIACLVQGGKQAAEAMIQVLGPAGGKIAILDFKPAESCLLRVQGFKEVMDAHNKKPGVAPITIVKELPGGGVKDMAYKATEDLLQAHDDLRGIFAINDPSALGARAALEKADRADKVKIIGFDGQPEGKQAIKEGKIVADPIQFPDKLGHETARAIIRYFEGEEIAPVQLIQPQLYWQADALKELK